MRRLPTTFRQSSSNKNYQCPSQSQLLNCLCSGFTTGAHMNGHDHLMLSRRDEINVVTCSTVNSLQINFKLPLKSAVAYFKHVVFKWCALIEIDMTRHANVPPNHSVWMASDVVLLHDCTWMGMIIWFWVGEAKSTVNLLQINSEFPLISTMSYILTCGVLSVRVHWNRYDTACCHILHHVIWYGTLFHIKFHT